ncbi:Ubiquitin-associated domain containing protein [Parasponia andersonii]|uniref:Ubiquitin-associated domain containing protein n=1 Tax=Parasponia andersonii TaxID=3476 RepID=A0A2P5CDW1_PARAD|nr:Ubiquitin-associated domain containing protein [Parasponia andersonii]
MSLASRSKSKDKKASKESQKAAAKPSVPASASSGVPASAYNPILGTFHTLELSPTSIASSLQTNGRFRNIDESDDHSGSSLAAGIEYDSVSNNGSWSGESEDHKEKTNLPVRQETIPGAADNDKREKIRQKNEKKHQRQKERRALELHERCSGYLMSRKLEALAQQLVAMGFSQERATMALILNEGRVEESVNWLFEGGEEADKFRDQNLGGSNLKIDISEELARIADMETRYKCSKQEVERAVVACEGDLEKAAESLRELKQDPHSAAPKPEETGDPPTVSNGKLSLAVNQNMRPQAKSNPPLTIQQRKDERDFNYTKQTVTVSGSSESASKNLQPMKRVQPKIDWAKPQQPALPVDKRWPNAGLNPSVSYSLASPSQVLSSPAKAETHYVTDGNDVKNLQAGAVREPVIMMQRPQLLNTKQVQASMSSSLPGTAASWYPTSNVEVMRSSGFLPQITSSVGSLSPNNLSSNQMYHQFQYQQQQHQQLVPSNGPGDSPGNSRGNGLWSSRTGASPTLAAASSLGLFSGLGSAGSSGASSPVDWNTGGSMLQLDYTSIDWTLDRRLTSTRPNGLLLGVASYMKNNANIYETKASGLAAAQPGMRSASPNVNGVSFAGLQDGGAASSETSGAGSRDWTSPFEGEDLFSLPRQFVSSPSL